jgi:hypothetical protein
MLLYTKKPYVDGSSLMILHTINSFLMFYINSYHPIERMDGRDNARHDLVIFLYLEPENTSSSSMSYSLLCLSLEVDLLWLCIYTRFVYISDHYLLVINLIFLFLLLPS